MTKLRKYKLFLIGILLLGAFLRFFNTNWDQGNHLHPDERFLTMVSTAMVPPPTLADYLNPQTSTFNPTNIGHKFYVYGTFPLIANKFLAMYAGGDNYADLTLLGRMFSAFADVMVVLVLFKTIELFQKRYHLHEHIKYWGALFYAVAVLPIQLSHFFAVDTFLNLFMFSSFYFAVRFAYQKTFLSVALSGLFFGLAIASKVSAIYIAPLILFFLVKSALSFEDKKLKKVHVSVLLLCLVLFGLTSYLFGRLGDPYLFQSGNFFDPTPNALFLENIKVLQSWSTPNAWFPPALQWIHKIPVVYSLQNIIFFGIGLGYFALILVGLAVLLSKPKHFDLTVVLIWCFIFFLYQSTQFATTMRYFLPLYPFFAFIAALGFYAIIKRLNKYLWSGILFFVLLWPMFFFSIYTQEHSRTQASRWIYNNIPSGSVLLSEHWDDALPIDVKPPSTKTYVSEQLEVFGADTFEKWQKMDATLERGDYLILSSNRGWGSIPSVPERYPRMVKFYEDLFAGKTNYKKVAEYTSYPSLSYLGIPLYFPDDWSEEAFTVYDHPKVMIFEKQ